MIDDQQKMKGGQKTEPVDLTTALGLKKSDDDEPYVDILHPTRGTHQYSLIVLQGFSQQEI